MNVTLIGMPGAGKSCMGKMLAKQLGMRFIDGDKLIEKTVGKRLCEIISESGVEGFKKIEREILLSINGDGLIISPGGSAVYYPEVMENFKEQGIVVYLYVSPKTFITRIGDYSERGIAMKEGQSLDDLFNERAPLFEKYADLTVSCDGTAFARYKAILLGEVRKLIEKREMLI